MNNFDLFVETCTLHDEKLLNFHDIYESSSNHEIDSFVSNSQITGGALSYRFNNDNRVVIWRAAGNRLELIEHSNVCELNGNAKRIHFRTSLVLPKVHLHVYGDEPSHIVVLVATTNKIYRLILKIPSQEHSNLSIFNDLSIMSLSSIGASNNFDIDLQNVESSDMFVNPRGEALFAFKFLNQNISCVQMASIESILHRSGHYMSQQNIPIRFDLNQTNIVKRLWSGITRTQDGQSSFVSYKLFSQNDSSYLASLCKDFKIKIWCLKTNQCIHSEDLFKYIKSDTNTIWEQSRIDLISIDNSSILTVLISTQDEFKVCQLKLEMDGNGIKAQEMAKRIIKKNGDLLDMCMSRFNLWIMYKNEKECTEMLTIPICDDDESHNRIKIISQQIKGDSNHALIERDENDSETAQEEEFDDDDFKLINSGLDSNEIEDVYCKLIFEPYRFSKMDMIKSLEILRHSVMSESDIPKSLEELREIIVKSIEKEIQNMPNYKSLTEEEFVFYKSRCWSKYYTMLKQYDFDSKLPLGLYVNRDDESCIHVIRKSSVSVYNKADLSHCYHLIQMDAVKSVFRKQIVEYEISEAHLSNLFHILTSIRCIHDYLHNQPILYKNFSSEEPDQATSSHFVNMVADKLILDHKNFVSDLSKALYQINDFDSLLYNLEVVFKYFDSDKMVFKELFESEETMDIDGSTPLLRSNFTIDSVLASFRNLILHRNEFFRNFSVFINIICRFNEKIQIPRQIASTVEKKFAELSYNLLDAYSYLSWITEICPVYVAKSKLEKNTKRCMEILNEFSIQIKYQNDVALKSLILCNNRSSIVNNANQPQSARSYELLQSYLKNLFVFLWPANTDGQFELIKFFIFNGQYSHLRKYCTKIKWRGKFRNLRYFLLGLSSLFFEEIDESISYFMEASANFDKDRYLKRFLNINLKSIDFLPEYELGKAKRASNRRSIILTNDNAANSLKDDFFNQSSVDQLGDELNFDDENRLLILYFTKCIHFFDLNGNTHAVVELIKNILTKFQTDLLNKSELSQILFKSYMNLEMYAEAYQTLMNHFDTKWKRSNLKSFINELCNRNKVDTLVKFDYADFLQDVLQILGQRAQKSDLHSNDFYSVLYFMNIKQKDYRKAALAMYECALRLKSEISGISSLKRQEKCYLVCLNMLKLVDKKMQWLTVSNKFYQQTDDTSVIEILKNKTVNFDFTDLNENCNIVTIDEINRYYVLISKMIKLSAVTSNQNALTNSYSVDETILLLVKQGLFDDAIELCLAFKANQSSPLMSILLSLVDRCCNVENDNDMSANYLTEFELMKNNETLPSPFSPYINPTSFKWKLLHLYLEKFNDSNYYKAVCKRIIMLGHEIPLDIISSFKKLNLNALLQIYVSFGYWEEAKKMIVDYIKAIMTGSDVESFDIKDYIKSNEFKPVVFPYSVVDKLLYNLKDSEKLEESTHFKKILSEYLMQIREASKSQINLKA